MSVSFVLNGQRVRVDDIDPHVSLLTWLRASGLTGTKEGCAEGECGACAVALVRPSARGASRFEPVNSCLLPLCAVEGQNVVTVEGVAEPNGDLHPVQRSMVERGGSQCGYCTPGFVISLFCEYYRPGRDGYDPEAISGNLCRCTGYRPIVDVARTLASPEAGDRRLQLLARETPPLAAFEHHGDGARFARPTRLADVFRLLAASPESVLLAGGTDLMVQANQRYERWPVLISLDAVPELTRFDVGSGEIVLGAGLRLSELEERLHQEHAGEVPLLEQLLPLFSSRLIRNRATLGGNLATASPIGDSLPALLALDASVLLASAAGERRVALTDFFLGYRKTALGRGEVIVSVHVPRPLPARQRFYKVSKRPLDDISTVAAAFALDLDAKGRVERLCIAYGGVAAVPIRPRATEQLARGRPWTSDTLTALRKTVESASTPLSDHRGTAAYRRALMGSLLEKFFVETAEEAR